MEREEVGGKRRSEKLSAMNLIGEAFVDVRAFNTLHEIQYSVFGNRFVQLQEIQMKAHHAIPLLNEFGC